MLKVAQAAFAAFLRLVGCPRVLGWWGIFYGMEWNGSSIKRGTVVF